ncbi:hypothetical protein C8T65DRAFT_674990 [Cerioporus squamosus]|nr:hypothetical protein C8T65DRAFT_674990 [Cerioporus squamosus]
MRRGTASCTLLLNLVSRRLLVFDNLTSSVPGHTRRSSGRISTTPRPPDANASPLGWRIDGSHPRAAPGTSSSRSRGASPWLSRPGRLPPPSLHRPCTLLDEPQTLNASPRL